MARRGQREPEAAAAAERAGHADRAVVRLNDLARDRQPEARALGGAAGHAEEAVEEALCFGWIDGVLRPIDEEKFTLRYSPRKKGSIWSETNKRRVRKLIKQGRMTEAGLVKVREAKANGQWRAATLREETAIIPDDLRQALKANTQARRNFDRLAPSHKRQYIYWITSAKTDKTRQRRIQATVRLMTENKKPGLP